MPPVANGSQQRLRGFRAMPPVPALPGPGLNDLPIPLEFRVLAQLFKARFLKASNLDQTSKVVRIAGLHLLLVRELAALSCLRDARFDSTLHGVARQIVPSKCPSLSRAAASVNLTLESSWRSFRSMRIHHTAWISGAVGSRKCSAGLGGVAVALARALTACTRWRRFPLWLREGAERPRRW